MFVDFLLRKFDAASGADALVWRDQNFSYEWLHNSVKQWISRLTGLGIQAHQVVALQGDFSPTSVAIFLALIEMGTVLVPLTKASDAKRKEFLEIAEVETIVAVSPEEFVTVRRQHRQSTHALYSKLRQRSHPGLVLFSSGSTGKSKAAVHDFLPLLAKFETPRHAWRTLPFLLYDHIGGVNTMLYTLSNGGALVTVQDRTPENVLCAVERHRVELLPTSPTFLNLVLISDAWQNHDLSSLRLITYGTEPMPESTLRRFHKLLPEAQLLQTYGLSELGILRSKSRASDSLWVKIGGDGFETRVENGILHVKAQSAMLGYLNAPSPFTEDGWFNTQDRVEQDGEYIRILGRDSEIINVGGEKVYPSEVESVIQELENIVEAVVYGAKNPIVGNVVCARVTVEKEEDPKAIATRVKKHCSVRLQRYKVPVRVELAQGPQHNERFKRVR